jgi:cytoskeletal protein CcmA (bactofilin family)
MLKVIKAIKAFLFASFPTKDDSITIIAKGTSIEGSLVGGNMHVDGTISGKSKIDCNDITVGVYGIVNSNIYSNSVVHIYGAVKGSVNASSVFIHNGANVIGNINYSEELVIEEHSNYSGNIKKLLTE